jgi:very-short-patch-repair endonuclease
VIPLSQLPEDPSIQLVRPVPTLDEKPAAEFSLVVTRPVLTTCPFPPQILREWLVSGWDDPAQEATKIESVNRVPDGANGGETVTTHFADSVERVAAWQQWSVARDEWRGPELRTRNAFAFFERLYELHALLEKDGERLELMVGDGMLSWVARSNFEEKDVEIFHPLLLKRVELMFDPEKPEFRIVETDRDTELYRAPLIDIENLNAVGLLQREKDLASAGYHPMGFQDTTAFGVSLVHTLSASKGKWLDQPADQALPDPQMWRAPVLLVRRRTEGMANAITSILEDIDKRDIFPPAFGQIVGIPDEQVTTEETSAAGVMSSSLVSSPKQPEPEILLAKEANAEQLQIIRKLSHAGTVLVQGPPGTGKTHTIANIIGHLLAQGKTILVTSHTPKALRVLRDQVPKDLQALCVSALGSDRDARSQLEAAVSGINEHLARASVETLATEISQRTEERQKLMERAVFLTRQIREALVAEYRPVEMLGVKMTPADTARHCAKHAAASAWLPGPLKVGAELPLSVEELGFLYGTNHQFTFAEERDATDPLPDLESLPTPGQFESLCAEYRDLLASDLRFKVDWWVSGSHTTSDDLASCLEEIEREFSEHVRRQSWRPLAIVAGMQGGLQREVWETLCKKIAVAHDLLAMYAMQLHHRPKLSVEFTVTRQCEVYSDILTHIESGGRLGFVQLVTRGEWKRVIHTATVSAGRPDRAEHFKALKLLADLTRAREEFEQLWDRLIGRHGGTPFGKLGDEPEVSARAVIEEVNRCLDWHQKVWVPLTNRLSSLGLQMDKVLEVIPKEASTTSDYDIAEKACVEVLPPVIAAQIRRIRITEIETSLKKSKAMIFAVGELVSKRGCYVPLLAAIDQADPAAYKAALSYVRRLHAIATAVRERATLLDDLKRAAPAWSAAIASRISPHDGQSIPGDARGAWLCRQLEEEIARRHELDAEALQRALEENRRIRRDVTISLIDLKAWKAQLERVQKNHSVRQALVGWLDSVKRLKSTQKLDIRVNLLAEARRQMRLASRAVPVWIMPLSLVAENFEATSTRFDVVIIDEASQADLNALVPLYLAEKAVIVGDHEQVTPDAVGKNQSQIHNLIDTYLRDIPNHRLFDNRFSIYDLGRQSFGDATCLLEHFRCVPEIIAFSNRLSYDGRIKPLREASSTPIKPACVPYRVNGVAITQQNRAEAAAIVDLVQAMCQHPMYAGKTIGIISMVGEHQAHHIDEMLRQVLDPVEYQHRRIICGNSAQMQGDERDIVLLSMVDSGKEFGLGPIAMRGEGAFEATKKRYNVASSRARDQLWVVHSLDPDDDLKTGDLRRDLIRHAMDPTAAIRMFEDAAKHAESEFERQVLRILINAGYQVTPQWKVGYLRIDMVVQGTSKRLAVECDGDRWHPIEKLSEDMDRQAILERLGWTFARIRGSAFFRDPNAAMRPVFERLEELGIAPHCADLAKTEESALVDEIKARAAQIHSDRDKPNNEEADDESTDEAAPSQPSPSPQADLALDRSIPRDASASSPHTGTNRRLQRALDVESTWDKVVEELHRTQPQLDTEQLLREAARSKRVRRIGWRIRQEIGDAIKRVLD